MPVQYLDEILSGRDVTTSRLRSGTTLVSPRTTAPPDTTDLIYKTSQDVTLQPTTTLKASILHLGESKETETMMEKFSSFMEEVDSFVHGDKSKTAQLFQVALLGDLFVGKTCFLERWRNDSFSERYVSTTELTECSKTLALKDIIYDVEIWDLPADCLTSEDPAFKKQIKAVHGVILLFSLTSRKSLQQITLLWKKIQEISVGAVVGLVVGNKQDGLPFLRQVSTQEGIETARSLGCNYMEISLKDANSTEECMRQLIDIKSRTSEVHQKKKSPVTDSNWAGLTRSGFLQLERRMHKWKPSYFTIREDGFLYYSKDATAVVKSKIQLDDVKLELGNPIKTTFNSKRTTLFTFTLFSPKQKFVLGTDSLDERQAWILAILANYYAWAHYHNIVAKVTTAVLNKITKKMVDQGDGVISPAEWENKKGTLGRRNSVLTHKRSKKSRGSISDLTSRFSLTPTKSGS